MKAKATGKGHAMWVICANAGFVRVDEGYIRIAKPGKDW
jgi:hypothetical protein